MSNADDNDTVIDHSCHRYSEQARDADGQDAPHEVAFNTGWRNRTHDVGGSHFLWTCSVTTHCSNLGYPHPLYPPCLCGDEGSNVSYG